MPFIVPTCEDEGICVEFEKGIDKSAILIVKMDDFYNSLGLKETPPSVDCLIVQYCLENNFYKIHLVELKNQERAALINHKNIEGKFETALYDFLSDKFRHIFFDVVFEIRPRLILSAGKVQANSIKAYSLDFLLGLKMFRFQNRTLAIHGYPPQPLIKSC